LRRFALLRVHAALINLLNPVLSLHDCVHAAAIFTTLHKVYVRLSLFTEAGKVLQTAQHKGLLDISDTDKSKPFAIRILDNSTLSASAQPVASLIPETVAMIFGTIRMHP
jgi:formate hydrogenlyase subunit 3/multisubunit Na+/H+ antiporter MnhD subunit